MKNILQPMTDFVLAQHEQFEKYGEPQRIKTIANYAKFLKQPLTLSMFVPVSKTGEVLSEPKFPHTYASENTDLYVKKFNKELNVYKEACNRVLFNGFTYNHVFNRADSKYACVDNDIVKKGNHNIEFLVGLGLPLSETALKQIYG